MRGDGGVTICNRDCKALGSRCRFVPGVNCALGTWKELIRKNRLFRSPAKKTQCNPCSVE